MFADKYHEWNNKRIKNIVDFYGFKYFYFKKVLDLGCGYGDLGGVLYRLGADLTCVDARQDHLKVVSKKFKGIKVVKANLDGNWPFQQKFDMTLDLGLLCHLSNYEEHLRNVCSTTTHLILETAVADSNDPNYCVEIKEDKGSYDLAYNGAGCRPSPAAIERVLLECGMNFKRIDNAKFNTEHYKYDWQSLNDNSTSLYKRKIWFCVKDSSPIQFSKTIDSSPPIWTPANNINNANVVNLPQKTVSPKVHHREPIKVQVPDTLIIPGFSMIQHNLPLNEKVKYDSELFSVINPEPVIENIDLSGTIYPTTFSSKLWFKKIATVFPKITVSNQALSMARFNQSAESPNIIMMSINNLQSYKRIFLEEWSGLQLTEKHIDILKTCETIITPSLINAQEIWKYYPTANIIRMAKPWTIIKTTPKVNNYLYFEKNKELTKLLFEAWEESFGHLTVINSSLPIPHFATFVSKYETYENIFSLILGCKGLIDLSENNYYHSGLLNLAQSLNINIITNNLIRLNNKSLISQDKLLNKYPTIDNIKQGIKNNKPSYIINNTQITEELRKLIG